MTDISSKHKTTNTRSNLHNSLNKYVYVMYSTCRAVLRAKLDLVTMSSLDFNTCRGMREKVERERERDSGQVRILQRTYQHVLSDMIERVMQ